MPECLISGIEHRALGAGHTPRGQSSGICTDNPTLAGGCEPGPFPADVQDIRWRSPGPLWPGQATVLLGHLLPINRSASFLPNVSCGPCVGRAANRESTKGVERHSGARLSGGADPPLVSPARPCHDRWRPRGGRSAPAHCSQARPCRRPRPEDELAAGAANYFARPAGPQPGLWTAQSRPLGKCPQGRARALPCRPISAARRRAGEWAKPALGGFGGLAVAAGCSLGWQPVCWRRRRRRPAPPLSGQPVLCAPRDCASHNQARVGWM